MLGVFSSYLDAVRQGRDIEALRNSIRPVILEIDEFLTEARIRYPGREMEAVNSMLAQQRLIVWLEEQFAELCADLNELPNEGATGQLRNVMVDGIDTVVLVIIDGLTSQDPEDWRTAMQLTGDRTEMLRRVRSYYTSEDIPLSDTTHASILKITNTAGEIFFLFSRLTGEIEGTRVLSAAPPTSRPTLR